MKLFYHRLFCCLTVAMALTLLATSTAFSQTRSLGRAQNPNVKPPGFTLIAPPGVLRSGDTFSVSAAKGFKVKRGFNPYQFFIGEIAVQPAFEGASIARIAVPALPSGTYFFQIRYQESRRKPVQVVFSQEVIISNDKIAFESNRDGNLEIYVMNPDGSNPTRLTNNPSEDYNPVFSPDGSKIAFQRRYYFEPDQDGISPDPYVEIHIMNADGTDERRLTNTPVSDVDNGDQVFSPDGSKIAFTSSRDNGSHEIYLMNADGTNQINLTSSPSYDSNPVFSPDGSKIAFQSDRGGSYGIWLMNADGSAPALLVNNVSSASRPVFSPDGTRIAFTSYVNDSYDIFTVDVASGDVTRLTDHAASDTSPVFSPDGSTLIFQSDRSGSAAIYSIDLDDPTHTITKLADGEDAAFSPDGAKIVFQSYSGGNYDIYVMNAHGSNAVCLTKNPASDINPVWG